MPAFTRRTVFAPLLAAGLPACRRGGSARVAVIPKTTAIDYWENLHAGAQEAAIRAGFRMFWNGPQSESQYAQQAQMVEDAIRDRVDGIVLAPTHGSVLASAVRHAAAENIPVVLVDSPVMVRPSEYVAYIGSDETKVGALAASRVAALLQGRGMVGVLGVSPTVEAAVQRERAFASELAAKHPEVKIVDVRYGLADHIRSRELARDMLHAWPKLGALFASDSFATRGAFAVLSHISSNVRLIGVAQERDMMGQLRAGTIDSLLVQDPFWMGRRAIEILQAALQGSPARAQRLEAPGALVTRENIDTPAIQLMVKRRFVK